MAATPDTEGAIMAIHPTMAAITAAEAGMGAEATMEEDTMEEPGGGAELSRRVEISFV